MGAEGVQFYSPSSTYLAIVLLVLYLLLNYRAIFDAPHRHVCLTSLGTCAKGVQFYCPSHTYAAITYCTILRIFAHCVTQVGLLKSH